MGEPFDYSESPVPVREDILEAHERAFERLRRAGSWWTGAERIEIAAEVPGVLTDDARRGPAVQFIRMGDSSLDFKLMCFIARPEDQPMVVDRLNTEVYKRLNAEDIEIPYPKRDIYIHRDG